MKRLEVKSSKCPNGERQKDAARYEIAIIRKKEKSERNIVHVVFPWFKSGLDKLH